MENNDNKNIKKNIIIIILIIIILILLYLLIRNFGHIENNGPKVPTGNVDIFEIDCSCGICEKTDDVFKEDDNNEQNGTNKNQSNNNRNKLTNEDIVVFDDDKTWDNKDLRIFSNPAFEYQNIIAPGSENSYEFVIKNKNNFDVTIDISFEEVNDKNINMQYKLRNNGNYLLGSENNYETIKDKKITNIKLSAKSQKKYILDWKWIDSHNDTEIGLDVTSNYKLSIKIGANQG